MGQVDYAWRAVPNTDHVRVVYIILFYSLWELASIMYRRLGVAICVSGSHSFMFMLVSGVLHYVQQMFGSELSVTMAIVKLPVSFSITR